MLNRQPDRPAPDRGAPIRDEMCPLARMYPGHVCRDRNGDPLDSRGRACFRGSRVQLVGESAGPVEAAEAIVADFYARVRGQR